MSEVLSGSVRANAFGRAIPNGLTGENAEEVVGKGVPHVGSVFAYEVSVSALPKIEPLPGSVQIEWKRCGRTNCRCRLGRLHGPYYARHWRELARQRKAYVSAADLPTVLLAIEAHRAAFPPASSMIAQVESAINARPSRGSQR